MSFILVFHTIPHTAKLEIPACTYIVVLILPDPQPLNLNLNCQPSAHINKCAVMYKLHEPWEIAKLMEPTINVIIYLIKKHTALYT